MGGVGRSLWLERVGEPWLDDKSCRTAWLSAQNGIMLWFKFFATYKLLFILLPSKLPSRQTWRLVWMCQLLSKAVKAQIMCHPQWFGKRCLFFPKKKKQFGYTCGNDLQVEKQQDPLGIITTS